MCDKDEEKIGGRLIFELHGHNNGPKSTQTTTAGAIKYGHIMSGKVCTCNDLETKYIHSKMKVHIV